MTNKIVVVGSSNTDMIVKSARIPQPGETILGGEFSTAAGGKGANQAVAAARAGGNVTFIARIGNDMLGKQALVRFKKDGIDTTHVFNDNSAPSGVALIMVSESGENSISVASGANANLNPDDIKRSKSKIEEADILLMQLESPIETIQTAAEIAKSSGIKVILNPAPAQELSSELLASIDIITPNETETEILTGIKVNTEEDLDNAVDKLLATGITTVLITLGSKGVLIAQENMNKIIPAYKVEAVDTTAAGDVFNGAFAVALANGLSLEEAVYFGNAAASISVTRLGAQPSAPMKSEIEEKLKGVIK